MRRRVSCVRSLLGLVAVVCLALVTALPVGCRKGNDGTYVLLRFDGSIADGASIAAIGVSTSLAGNAASATFTAPTDGGIVLPTTAYLDIGAGAGKLSIHAVARAATGATVGEGDGEGTVTRGQTSTVVIKLFPASPRADAGAPDLAQDAQSDLALQVEDAAVEKPIVSGTGGTGVVPGTGGTSAGADALGAGGGAAVATGGVVSGTGGLGTGGLGTGGLGTGGFGTGGLGTGGTGGVAADGGATPIIKLVSAPEGLTFSATAAGSDSGPQRLSLSNVGNVAVGPLDVASKDPVQFVIGTNACTRTTLQPGDNCIVTVSFKPAVSATQISDLVVSAPNLQTMLIPMTGLGMAQISSIELLPKLYDFGAVEIHSSDPATNAFTIRNTGNTVSTVNNVVLSVSMPEYRVVDDRCTGVPLNPSASCMFSVQFNPSSPGTYINTLNVRTNTGAGVSMPIEGTGKQTAVISIELTGNGKGSIQGTGVVCSETSCRVTVEITDATLVPSLALQAVPASNSVFAGYGNGLCDVRPSCTLNVTGSVTLTAQFDLR